MEYGMYDALLMFPKAKSNQTIIKRTDSISDKIRHIKLNLMAFATLDKKIAYFVSEIEKATPNERCTLLSLTEQSIYRDLLLSGLGIFIGSILIKDGISSVHKNKLFKIACVSTGFASLAFSGIIISDWVTLLNVISDLKTKYCRK